jgi:NAD(P)-dependent dehydrogenase (short-subunit alcohol dehydrogenase family)
VSNELLHHLGANQGIGLNLVKAFIGESWSVTGTVRPQTRADKDPTLDHVRSP